MFYKDTDFIHPAYEPSIRQ